MATSSKVRLLELEVCPVWPRVIPSPASPRISRVGNLRSGRWTGATEGAEPQRPQAWGLGTHTHCHLGRRQHWEARSRRAQRGRTQPVCPLHGLLSMPFQLSNVVSPADHLGLRPQPTSGPLQGVWKTLSICGQCGMRGYHRSRP